MVHKKSEYKLQYHFLTNDLRKRIWEDNLKFRKAQQATNQSEHFWSYQVTDEQCECDAGPTEGQGDVRLLRKQDELSPKHLTEYNKDTPDAVPVVAESHVHHAELREAAVQTPEWCGKEDRILPAEGKHAEPLIPAVPSSSHKSRSLKKVAVFPDASERARSSSAHVSRTRRRSYAQQQQRSKSPFEHFGWNDTNKDMGKKKTYNVSAPQTEVYEAALKALRKRQSEMDKFLEEESRKRRDAQQKKYPNGAVNHSSVWMSEYQAKYSPKFLSCPNSPRRNPACGCYS